jgi:hypothetical protein
MDANAGSLRTTGNTPCLFFPKSFTPRTLFITGSIVAWAHSLAGILIALWVKKHANTPSQNSWRIKKQGSGGLNK